MDTKKCLQCKQDIPWVTPTGRKIYPCEYKQKSFCCPLCSQLYSKAQNAAAWNIYKVCAICGEEISKFASNGRYKQRQTMRNAKYCSHACRIQSTRKIPHASTLQAHFESLRDKSGGPQACWPFKSTLKLSLGYGVFSYQGKHYRAHRLALLFDGRPVPDDMYALHACDNKACCNPAHLSIGTHRENAEQASERGLLIRNRAKLQHPLCKLTAEQAIELRRIVREKRVTPSSLAKWYPVTHPTILRAVRGKGAYSEIKEEPPCDV